MSKETVFPPPRLRPPTQPTQPRTSHGAFLSTGALFESRSRIGIFDAEDSVTPPRRPPSQPATTGTQPPTPKPEGLPPTPEGRLPTPPQPLPQPSLAVPPKGAAGGVLVASKAGSANGPVLTVASAPIGEAGTPHRQRRQRRNHHRLRRRPPGNLLPSQPDIVQDAVADGLPTPSRQREDALDTGGGPGAREAPPQSATRAATKAATHRRPRRWGTPQGST